MTREDIIRMKSDELRQSILRVCRVAGADSDFNIVAFNAYCDSLMALGAAAEREKWMERTAILIRGEREACAKVCEDAPEPDGRDLAERIRARSNT